jgi:hypothetical protein
VEWVSLAFDDFVDIESVLAVRVDPLESCRAEMRDGVVVDASAFGVLVVDGVLEVDGVGEDASVGDEAEAVGLHRLVFVMAVSHFLAVGERDEVAKIVAAFASVELSADATSEGFVAEPAEVVQGADQFAVLE